MWRKDEKSLYLPGSAPVVIDVPKMNFLTISGSGNPNDAFFTEYISVLYSLSYTVKMSPKKSLAPQNYYDYTVYPLEGVWDISEESKKEFNGTIDKNNLEFQLMIRQPDFVDTGFAQSIIELTSNKKPHPLLAKARFESIAEGMCVQMLHTGSYDSEPASFEKMEAFASSGNLMRKSKVHREIYLSDARKVSPEKLKTVLRFRVEPAE